LSSVIPADRINLVAGLQSFDLLCAAKVPNGDNCGVLCYCGHECTVFGEEQALDRPRQREVGGRRAILDIKDLDLPIHATSGNKMTVRVELHRKKSYREE
jgi:hypothetical protein